MANLAIEVKGLKKKYRIGKTEKPANTAWESLFNGLKSPLKNLRQIRSMSNVKDNDDSIFWALKDISFNVKQGEVLGIVGHNGAGKSTLLKILSRITEPSDGEIRVHGRIAALLEVGTGFHPELTGRENIFMNGTILGMRKHEIKDKLDEIVDFSGVEKYLDTPVKFYSSGMRVRLGFAVAAHLEPEILIIDEVLAVGDAEFQKKCLAKMENVAEAGRTVIFVSHDLTAVQNLCQNAILLNAGLIEKTGEVFEVVDHYFNNSNRGVRLSERLERRGKGEFRFVDFKVRNNSSGINDAIFTGDSISIELSYKLLNDVKSPHIAISISHSRYGIITALSNYYSGVNLVLNRPMGTVVCHLDKLFLLPGVYYATIFCSVDGDRQDVVSNAFSFEVLPKDIFGSGRMMDSSKQGVFYMDQRWEAV